jgi:hypothetical protein
MTNKFATYAAIIALSAATTVAAQAASRSDQDQRENQVTSQLNQQQLQGGDMGYGTQIYQGTMQSPNQSMMQEQVAQPPAGSSDLSIIE